MSILLSIIGIIITILLVVGVHEFGHFYVAKLCGVKVLRFSIGFGKTLFRWQDKQGTEYVLAAIPLGGYVKMLDENEEAVSEDQKTQAFNNQPYFKKMAIIAAGPITNFIFAFLIYWLLFVVGFVTVAPVVGKVAPGSIAAVAGIKPEERIVSIDNHKIDSWVGVIIHMLARAGDKNTMQIKMRPLDSEQVQDYQLPLEHWQMDDLRPDPLISLGITPYEPVIPNVVGKVLPDSPAAIAGLMPGDKIIAINNKPSNDWLEVVSSVIDQPGKTLTLKIIRDKKPQELTVTVGSKRHFFHEPTGFLGMNPEFTFPKELLHKNQHGPIQALAYAWQDTVLFLKLNFIILGKMVTGKISFQSLGGPITIFESAGAALNNGALAFMSFLAFLSISIGIINILPIPGLDGGHLLLHTVESATGKPLTERVQLLLYRFGLIFLFLIMIQAFVNDILRL